MDTTRKPFVDAFGREVRKIRLSVTDRCNFRCLYCLPEEPVWLPRAEVLTFEEIERVVRAVVPHGVTKLRLTGGEPLLRRDLERLVAALAAVPGVEGLSMTTNGWHLAEKAKVLRDAGLRTVTVSLDALDAQVFEALVRKPGLDRVLEGIHAAIEAGFERVKVNVVVMRGMNEDQIPAFAELARSGPFVVRFIEFMPLDSGGTWDLSKVVPGREVRARIEERYPLEPVPEDRAVEADAAAAAAGATTTGVVRAAGHDPAREYRFRDGRGTIGFISSVSEPFCGSCDRIRLTAEGKILNCLFGLVDYDVRAILRGGGTDEELVALIRRAVHEKEAGHLINRPGFIQPRRAMASIGG